MKSLPRYFVIAFMATSLISAAADAQIQPTAASLDAMPYGALASRSAREAAVAEYIAQRAQSSLDIPKIAGGVSVEPGKYPWIVAIGYFDGKTFVQYCAGSVIGSQWILTAAHCDVQRGDAVIAKVTDLSQVTMPSATVDNVTLWFYDRKTLDQDFALLHLNAGLDVKPIPISHDAQFETANNNKFTIAGWGRIASGGATSKSLLEAQITTVAVGECKSSYRVVSLNILDGMFCGSADKRDACQGDSGGPAMRLGPKGYVLIGIVSWGKSCGQKAFPGVYTRASVLASRVEQTSAGANGP